MVWQNVDRQLTGKDIFTFSFSLILFFFFALSICGKTGPMPSIGFPRIWFSTMFFFIHPVFPESGHDIVAVPGNFKFSLILSFLSIVFFLVSFNLWENCSNALHRLSFQPFFFYSASFPRKWPWKCPSSWYFPYARVFQSALGAFWVAPGLNITTFNPH